MGGTLCLYLSMKSQLPRSYLRECAQPTCSWDDWNHAVHNASIAGSKTRKQRIVLSYGHNGFGNQLWQHTIAFMVAESLNARLLISIIPDELSFDGATPPNTFAGMAAMERLLPDEFEYDLLPTSAIERQICDEEKFFLSDRPRDWRNHTYSASFKQNIYNLLKDPLPRCIKMLGYFQNYPLCSSDVKQLWTPRMFANFTHSPGPNDISIYLRCLPRHYHFNDRHFYEAIMNRTKFDKVWLFQAPECPTKLSNDPSKDGIVSQVVRYLVETFNASRWVVPEDLDDTSVLLHDLSGLAHSQKLILPVSSWAFWAGMFSNATEIHVNSPPHHPIMYNSANYIYHDDKHGKFFGRYSNITNEIEYAVESIPVGRRLTRW